MAWFPGNEQRHNEFTSSKFAYAVAGRNAAFAQIDGMRRILFPPAQFTGDVVSPQLNIRRRAANPSNARRGIPEFQGTFNIGR